MTPAEMAERNDLLARLTRLERKVDEVLRLVRGQQEEVPAAKRRRVINGQPHMFFPGTGWVPEWPEQPTRRRK